MALGLFTAGRRAIEDRADSFEKRIGQLATGVSGRFSRGNIAMQHGRVLTAEKLNAERDARQPNKRGR